MQMHPKTISFCPPAGGCTSRCVVGDEDTPTGLDTCRADNVGHSAPGVWSREPAVLKRSIVARLLSACPTLNVHVRGSVDHPRERDGSLASRVLRPLRYSAPLDHQSGGALLLVCGFHLCPRTTESCCACWPRGFRAMYSQTKHPDTYTVPTPAII